MSDSTPPSDTPEPSLPKPDTPKPNIPKPSIPKPNIPAPNLDRSTTAAPLSSVDSGAMETPVAPSEPEVIEESTPVAYTETLLPQRMLAGLIDYVAASVLVGVSSLVMPDFLSSIPTGLGFVYLLFKDSLPFLGGQSLGKKVTKIQAVTSDGEPLTKDLKAGLLRNITAAIPLLAIVEAFVLNSREKASNVGLRLGDDFAGTKVISVAPPAEDELAS